MMRSAYLPNINILLQIEDVILALTNPCNFVFALTRLEPRKNYKDLYGVTGACKGQYLIPK